MRATIPRRHLHLAISDKVKVGTGPEVQRELGARAAEPVRRAVVDKQTEVLARCRAASLLLIKESEGVATAAGWRARSDPCADSGWAEPESESESEIGCVLELACAG